jgi:hypothetical protein
VATRLPKAPDVSRIVAGLIGKDPAIVACKTQFKPAPNAPVLVGEYLTPEKALVVLLVCDLEFAARSGAALTMMPQNVVEGSIRSGKMDPGLMENYYEIANVLTAAFAAVETRLVLRTVFEDAAKLPEEAQAILKKPKSRLDMEANIVGYGKGKLTLLAA